MCGAVRFSMSEPIRFSLLCHCRDCQRISGGGHAALFGATRRTTALSGKLSLFEYRADSGATMTSGVCAKCGNPIFKLSSRYEALYFFHAATLDRPELFVPTRAVWARSARPWNAVSPTLPTEL